MSLQYSTFFLFGTENCFSLSKPVLVDLPGGGGVLPYMGFIAMVSATIGSWLKWHTVKLVLSRHPWDTHLCLPNKECLL